MVVRSDDINFFSGVVCDNTTGAVTFLELPGGCLRGTLRPNSSLFELSHLRHLNLCFNNFDSSPLSSAFGQLKNLEVLLLSSAFGQLKNLENNHFEAKIIDPIFKLVNLEYLSLSSLNISHMVDLTLFSSLRSLSYLHLSRTSLTPWSVNSDIKVPKDMEILILSGCNISEFPRFLKSLKKLLFLDLSNNRIKGDIPDWLWSLPLLVSLDLHNNSFTGFKGSLDHVLANSSVQILDIASNSFKGSFPNPPVSIINLAAWNNSFTGEIPLSVYNRSALDLLDLSYNNFTGSIPPCMGNFTIVNLQKTKLEGNIPDEFCSGALTQTFDVGYNKLTGKLPRSLLNCSLLRFLSVHHNRINDSFPFSLKALPNLKVLILRSNRFCGPISPPDEQGPLAFPKLQILELSHNRFTETLPTNYFANWSATSAKIMMKIGYIWEFICMIGLAMKIRWICNTKVYTWSKEKFLLSTLPLISLITNSKERFENLLVF
ncbi:PREDICTED: receptor-like protein 12 [Camelina sativa]|uniref:Receptor-like protein 12 n=1 Tax=Camelina sativa TaxID=90675 RepID=A0ABM0WNZ0_CAMSA|nr:PREDICTED: receptor-like protein 12 [Camelina sativa]